MKNLSIEDMALPGEQKRRGRPPLSRVEKPAFDPTIVELKRGAQMEFDASIFKPLKTGTEIDHVFSTEGGLMPATNMVLVGGPGSYKTSLTLDWMAELTKKGFKCLFVSGEMDEIAFYKYCKRMPKIDCVQTLFLRQYASNVKEVLEYEFTKGYDVIAVDSIAEVIDMYKDSNKCQAGEAEFWFLNLQDNMKNGRNEKGYYTSFINIQQVTKSGEFAGSNRLKHMTDAMAHIERSKDGLDNRLYFSKNRDCDKETKIHFRLWNGEMHYTYETI